MSETHELKAQVIGERYHLVDSQHPDFALCGRVLPDQREMNITSDNLHICKTCKKLWDKGQGK